MYLASYNITTVSFSKPSFDVPISNSGYIFPFLSFLGEPLEHGTINILVGVSFITIAGWIYANSLS